MRKKILLMLAIITSAVMIVSITSYAMSGGMPAIHELPGRLFGRAVNEMAQSEPGAVAQHFASVNELDEEGAPPPWVEEKVRERKEWSESGEEGPPPWAPEHAREHWEWSESGEEGPPPWVEEKVRERQEWSESGEEGPPPWAGQNAEEKREWSESGKEGPPPWASAGRNGGA
jgi:hypothetical protein